jgi:hypothetical protein
LRDSKVFQIQRVFLFFQNIVEDIHYVNKDNYLEKLEHI